MDKPTRKTGTRKNVSKRATLDERLRFYGWTHEQRRPELGPCWKWEGNTSPQGYGQLRADGRVQRTHRIAYQAWVGPIPDGMVVRHKCDYPSCINPAHLEIGTHGDNVHDAMRRGRAWHPRGESHGIAKLTENDVREIRRLHDAGVLDFKHHALTLGVAPSTVRNVALRVRWGHVLD